VTRTTIFKLMFLTCLLCQANASFAAPPHMNAHRLTTSPVINGVVVGDEAWASVVPASGFRQVQPNDGQPSSQKTEVSIGYSDSSHSKPHHRCCSRHFVQASGCYVEIGIPILCPSSHSGCGINWNSVVCALSISEGVRTFGSI